MIRFDHIVIGGTFDRLHKGHQAFIQHAFKIARKVTIAVTCDPFNKDKSLPSVILPYEKRIDEIESFVNKLKMTDKSKIVELNNIYGIALEDSTLDAILVTLKTKSNAKKINTLRGKKGLKKLEIVIFPLIRGFDKKIISSSRIRSGEISRVGLSFQSLIKKSRIYNLPVELRESLRKPIGQIVRGKDLEKTAKKAKKIIEVYRPTTLVSVGDVVSMSLIKVGLNPDISIIDLKTQRHSYKYFSNKFSSQGLLNKPGTINCDTSLIIKNYLLQIIKENTNEKILIYGEEDLLALPAILLAPLNSIIAYGQTNSGIVLIYVTESCKEMALSLLKKFNTSKS